MSRKGAEIMAMFIAVVFMAMVLMVANVGMSQSQVYGPGSASNMVFVKVDAVSARPGGQSIPGLAFVFGVDPDIGPVRYVLPKPQEGPVSALLPRVDYQVEFLPNEPKWACYVTQAAYSWEGTYVKFACIPDESYRLCSERVCVQ